MEFLENAEGGKVQDIRQDEINGKQHYFHSFPKEFQAWHNTQYMMEKKMPIDESTVPEALLNGYMWQAMGDASVFGITSFFAIVFAVIKLKLSPTLFGLFISLLVFAPWLLYSAYHFVFYAKIRAQVVGPVTQNGYRYTSRVFYETYASIVVSMVVAFLFIMSILDDIMILIRDYILTLDPSDMYDSWIKSSLTSLYNFLVELMTPPQDTLGKILFNEYITATIFLVLLLGTSYMFEQKVYTERKAKVEEEKEHEREITGYPIDNAFRKLRAWRAENGV